MASYRENASRDIEEIVQEVEKDTLSDQEELPADDEDLTKGAEDFSKEPEEEDPRQKLAAILQQIHTFADLKRLVPQIADIKLSSTERELNIGRNGTNGAKVKQRRAPAHAEAPVDDVLTIMEKNFRRSPGRFENE